jgi:hypothetical protein
VIRNKRIPDNKAPITVKRVINGLFFFILPSIIFCAAISSQTYKALVLCPHLHYPGRFGFEPVMNFTVGFGINIEISSSIQSENINRICLSQLMPLKKIQDNIKEIRT